jgi:hypothetical protein
MQEKCYFVYWSAGTCEVADDTDSYAFRVVRGGVSSHGFPAASLINVAVFTDQEVVANVVPVVRVHVVVLVGAHDSSTLILRAAVHLGAAVMHQRERHWHTQLLGGLLRRSSAPFLFADNPRAYFCIISEPFEDEAHLNNI